VDAAIAVDAAEIIGKDDLRERGARQHSTLPVGLAKRETRSSTSCPSLTRTRICITISSFAQSTTVS
jgi:hypothetical protein